MAAVFKSTVYTKHAGTCTVCMHVCVMNFSMSVTDRAVYCHCDTGLNGMFEMFIVHCSAVVTYFPCLSLVFFP